MFAGLYPQTGTVFPVTWTPPSPTPMARPTSSRAPSTGGFPLRAKLTRTTPEKSVLASPGSQTTLMPLSPGRPMTRSTSSRALDTGSLTLKDRSNWTPPTRSPSPTGTAFPITSTLPSSTPTASHTSSKLVATTASTTRLDEWMSQQGLPSLGRRVSGGLAVNRGPPPLWQ